MPTALRCPGFKHPSVDPAAIDDPADLARHTTWTAYRTNPPARRYRCRQCEAYYAYLVDVAEQPPERYVRPGPLGQVHPDDPHDYGN